MADDAEQIRTLVEQWAAAVHRGDMEGVLADHADDIVMFDVPPPHQGIHGIRAYRDTWPPFFDWQAQGACFEIESIDVTAGTDVAFVHALLRCGTPQELSVHPENRLRLTLGLRKEQDRWVVAHEHHSFPHVPPSTAPAEQQVRTVHERWFEQTAAKDLDGLMAHIADDIVSYEHETPLEYTGANSVREVCRHGLEATSGTVGWTVPDLKVRVSGDIAVAWGLNRMTAQQPDGTTAESWSRGTRVFENRDGAWLMIHQHVSYPQDPETGRSETDLSP